MSDNIKRKMEKYATKFKEINDKLKDCEESILKFQKLKQQLWDESNIVKGRYNELKELLGDNEKATSVFGGATAGVSQGEDKVIAGPGSEGTKS